MSFKPDYETRYKDLLLFLFCGAIILLVGYFAPHHGNI